MSLSFHDIPCMFMYFIVFSRMCKDLLVKASRSFRNKRDHMHYQGLFITYAMVTCWRQAEHQAITIGCQLSKKGEHNLAQRPGLESGTSIPVAILRTWSMLMTSMPTHAHLNFTGPPAVSKSSKSHPVVFCGVENRKSTEATHDDAGSGILVALTWMVLNGHYGHYQHWIDPIAIPLNGAISSTDVRPSAAPRWLILGMPLAFSGEPYCGSWITTALRSEGTLNGLILHVCLRKRSFPLQPKKKDRKERKHQIHFWSSSSLNLPIAALKVHALSLEAAAPCRGTSATNPSTKTWPVAADLKKAYRARRSWAGNISPGTAYPPVKKPWFGAAWAAWVRSP